MIRPVTAEHLESLIPYLFLNKDQPHKPCIPEDGIMNGEAAGGLVKTHAAMSIHFTCITPTPVCLPEALLRTKKWSCMRDLVLKQFSPFCCSKSPSRCWLCLPERMKLQATLLRNTTLIQ